MARTKQTARRGGGLGWHQSLAYEQHERRELRRQREQAREPPSNYSHHVGDYEWEIVNFAAQFNAAGEATILSSQKFRLGFYDWQLQCYSDVEGKGNAARDPVFHLERMIVEPQQHQQSPTGSAPDRVRPPAVAWYRLTVRNRTFPTRKLEMFGGHKFGRGSSRRHGLEGRAPLSLATITKPGSGFLRLDDGALVVRLELWLEPPPPCAYPAALPEDLCPVHRKAAAAADSSSSDEEIGDDNTTDDGEDTATSSGASTSSASAASGDSGTGLGARGGSGAGTAPSSCCCCCAKAADAFDELSWLLQNPETTSDATITAFITTRPQPGGSGEADAAAGAQGPGGGPVAAMAAAGPAAATGSAGRRGSAAAAAAAAADSAAGGGAASGSSSISKTASTAGTAAAARTAARAVAAGTGAAAGVEASSAGVEGSRRTFPVHRGILAARCPYFRALFGSGMADSGTRDLTLPDTDPAALEALLGYMYGGRLQLPSRQLARSCLQLADVLLLQPAADMLTRHLVTTASPDSYMADLLLASGLGGEGGGQPQLLAGLLGRYPDLAEELEEGEMAALAAGQPGLEARLKQALAGGGSSGGEGRSGAGGRKRQRTE